MDEERRALEAIWAESDDHRSIVFENGTDLWIEVIGTFSPKRPERPRNDEEGQEEPPSPTIPSYKNFSSFSKMRVEPRSSNSWKFLGESAGILSTLPSMEILALFPDSYELAVKHEFTFVAKALQPQDCDGPDILVGGQSTFHFNEIPKLGPGETFSIRLACKTPSPLQLLCKCVLLRSVEQSQASLDPISSSSSSSFSSVLSPSSSLCGSSGCQVITLKDRVAQLPLPNRLKNVELMDLFVEVRSQ